MARIAHLPRFAAAALFALAAVPAQAGDALVLEVRGLGTYWRPLALQPPSYPRGQSGQACVHLAFRIDRDGRVRELAVLRQWASTAGEGATAAHDGTHEAFARHAAAAALQWRFAPTGRNEQPVLTALNLAFDDRGRGQGEAVRAHCAIDDLPRFVHAAQQQVGARGNIALAQADRIAETDPPFIPRDRHGWGATQPGDAP